VNVGWLIFGFRLLSRAAWRWRPSRRNHGVEPT